MPGGRNCGVRPLCLTNYPGSSTLSLMSETLPLDIDHARQTMADWPVGHTLLYTPRVASTMIPARRALETPEYASGVVCVTEEQSAGKGRLAR